MISLNPKYNEIDQKLYCCVPASLLMILDRKNMSYNFTQDDIAYELGLTVPTKAKDLFDKARVTDIKPISGYGTQIQKEEFSLSNFLKEHKLEVECEIIYLNTISNFKEFIMENLNCDNDIIVCFNYNKLYHFGNDGGHVSLIESIDEDKVTLVDPDFKYLPKRKIVIISSLMDAVKHHETEMGGIWLISNK